MATVIRRTSEIGDPRLARVPFPEPGPAPLRRLSSLGFQGLDGEEVGTVLSADGAGSLTAGTGDLTRYRIDATGVPGYRYDCTVATATTPKRPTLYNDPPAGSPLVLTQLVVARMFRQANAPSGLESFAQLLRSSFGGTDLLAVGGTNSSAAGRVVAGAGGSGLVVGPEWPADGRLRFAAVTFSGTAAKLYLDGEVVSGTVNATTGYRFLTGFAYSGADYEIVEAAQYTTALTPAQIEEKRAHYRSLYQF